MSSSSRLAEKEFLSTDRPHPKYLFGCNDHSAALAEAVLVDGFVDDFQAGGTFCGKPVVAGEQVPSNAAVVNCVLMARSWASKRRVQSLNVAVRLDYGDLLACDPSLAPVPKFVSDTLEDQEQHGERWAWLLDRLQDETSKQVLRDVSGFRTSANLTFLASYSFAPAEQYFTRVCPVSAHDVFVDCGGFDGDTTEQFIRRCPDYHRVWLFEPAEANMLKAKARLHGVRDIHFVPKGVSSKPGTLSFDAGAGSASAISDAGESRIEVTTLDEEVDEPVTFIKMDLEGWELHALSGAAGHITRDHPKLAIAVYHQASDFWRIPEFILGLRDDYDIHLRHYTEGWTETVMYFAPR